MSDRELRMPKRKREEDPEVNEHDLKEGEEVKSKKKMEG